ncbi:glycogen/starch/alpha-glucan phosphorylase [Niameybacter sp.]|uniref:glycogen/starch/alpha-glucan phosphorylase n=1 Tax=Niameybacter sp. TaxID=2033640 RepID=UPI002FC926F4
MINKQPIKEYMEMYCKMTYGKTVKHATTDEVWSALSTAIMSQIVDRWYVTTKAYKSHKMAFYISAEYLMGRALGNNLINLQAYDEVKNLLKDLNIDLNEVEDIEEDAALGNGGLGRLAACFMDSSATMHLPVQGYGLRYRNGLFKQCFKNGEQVEEADEWLRYGDPWSIRKADDTVYVNFADMQVKAVPYDVPIVGFKGDTINTLRLWQAEPLCEFDFNLYNNQQYDKALEQKNRTEDITRVLYPNDSTEQGKLLRLRQQYFLVSASIQDIVRDFKCHHGNVFTEFAKWHAMQLNDTHPVLAIPEFIRILVDEEGESFEKALDLAREVFAYTNHTILQEALEKWNAHLIQKLFPRIYQIIEQIDKVLVDELVAKGWGQDKIYAYHIIKDGKVHMANLAIYVGFSINGVAKLHTDILKQTELHHWYELYPYKFQNKTNGITPRRWLVLANQELASLITEKLGNNEWMTDLTLLKQLTKYTEDTAFLESLQKIKYEKKCQLANYIKAREGIDIDPNSLFDIQVKRLHEYKRQLLNALYILDLYFRLKENPNLEIPKVTFIFGAKAFPGYYRAKNIIKLILAISELIDKSPEVSQKIKVVFVTNYNVSYAQAITPAADLSKQVSTAGKEASGTGNMKFMLNGAPTFGTYDGANVEIVAESGEENNFIFGLRVEDIEKLRDTYNPRAYYEANPDIKRVLEALIDGTLSSTNRESFRDIYEALLNGKNWERPDQYYVLADFKAFKDMQEKVFECYQNPLKWAKMSLMNIANSGVFSSDRTIMQYASEIWGINPIN